MTETVLFVGGSADENPILFRRKSNRCDVFELVRKVNYSPGIFRKFDPSPFRKLDESIYRFNFSELEGMG